MSDINTASPFANCRFKLCDFPGQCLSEGKCHHPRTVDGVMKRNHTTQEEPDLAANVISVLKVKLAVAEARIKELEAQVTR